MKVQKFYVYKITNLVNGKLYIGKTNNPEYRWKSHIWVSTKPNNRAYSTVHKAIFKYGIENFSFEIIQEYNSDKEALEGEIYYIKYFNTRENGYNLTDGGDGSVGYIASQETRKKLSEIQSNRKRRKLTEKEKEKIKQKRKNQKHIRYSLEDKNKILKMYRTNNYTKQQIADLFDFSFNTVSAIIKSGKNIEKFEPYIVSKETRKKISKASKGRKLSEEAKEKLSKIHTGKIKGPHSIEHRNKIANSLLVKTKNKKIFVTDEMKVKAAETHKRRGLLSDAQKQEIIDSYNAGNYRKQDLADKYNIELKTILYVTGKLAKRGILTKEEKRINCSNARKGKKLSDEHKLKISEAHKNKCRKLTEEDKLKISIKNSGKNNGMYGKTVSNNQRLKRSQSQKNRKPRRKLTEEEKKKLSEKLKICRTNITIDTVLKEKILKDWNLCTLTKKQIAEKYHIKYNTVVGVIRRHKIIP